MRGSRSPSRIEFRETGREFALGAGEQEAGFLEAHAGEAHVEFGFQLVGREGADLLEDDRASGDGLRGHVQHALRLKDGEIGDGDLQFDLPLHGADERVLDSRFLPRHFDLVVGAAEVGEQLRGVEADGGAVEHLRDAQRARGSEARVVLFERAGGGEVAGERGEIIRAGLGDRFARGAGAGVARGDARVRADGGGLGLGKRQLRHFGGAEFGGERPEAATQQERGERAREGGGEKSTGRKIHCAAEAARAGAWVKVPVRPCTSRYAAGTMNTVSTSETARPPMMAMASGA